MPPKAVVDASKTMNHERNETGSLVLDLTATDEADDAADGDVMSIMQRKASKKRTRTEFEGELSLEQFRSSPTYCRIPASSVAAACGLNPFSNLPQLLFDLVYQTYLGQLLLQMDATALEQTLMDFIKGYYEVLVCTNIIETGLDIANANTIIINNAHHFGLSDLHQLRGRVGRSNKKAFCYLLAPPLSTLTSDARKRLRTVEQFSELGSGFNIAMRDLDIRGAGNLLGGEQSGFVMNMGYETYQKILNESIQELKETDYKDLFKEEIEKKREFVKDVNVESDLDLMIPDEYVSSIKERLALYQQLNKVKNEEDISKFDAMMKDRFGELPKAVNNLFEAIRIRWLAKGLGFERIILKNRKLRCYFIGNQQSAFFDSDFFKLLINQIQKTCDHRFYLKESSKYLMLVCENVKSLAQVNEILSDLDKKAVSTLDEE